jgi:hypothetical protein
MKVSIEEYKCFVRVMFLLSDKFMAEKYPDFKEDQKINDEETMEELKKLVEEWESMP